MHYFEHYKTGDRITTRGRTITEADIVNFAGFTGDWYPLHTDVEYAKKSPFGERIAHGYLILSVQSGLFPLYDMAIEAFYGIDKVRFINPCRIGDTLHLEIEVTDKKDKNEKAGVVVFSTIVKNQRDEDVVILIQKTLVKKKPKDLKNNRLQDNTIQRSSSNDKTI